MSAIKRALDMDLPSRQSAFLWGPRKTGKSTYLKSRFSDSIVYDLLLTDQMIRFSKSPFLLREELLLHDDDKLTRPIILDEVQKVPQILDEVHWLIENRNLRFILCGSSARKLKRGRANLLGGRAWRYELRPLTFAEVTDFQLLRALNHGLVPIHYLQNRVRKSLKAYVNDYLKEEVFDEGLTRNIPAFSRFFDAMGYSHGELTNFSKIASDCGVDSKTVKEYYQILVDTLLGTFIEPFKKKQNRQVIRKASKFYFFDVGIAGIVTGRYIEEERGDQFGKAFEHFILMELLAYRSYFDLDYRINFWLTKTGLEVDFVLGDGEIAIEVKGSQRVDNRELKGIQVFTSEFSPRKSYLVCNETTARARDNIVIMPWREFLGKLWQGNIIQR